MAPPIYVRAPDHLGDGVLALPALEALRSLGSVVVKGPGWVLPLYGHLASVVTKPPRGAALGVLLKPAFRAAWEARGVERVLGTKGDHRGWLLSEALPRPPGHRSEEYRGLALAAGVPSELLDGPWLPSLPPGSATTPAEAAALLSLGPEHVLLLPGSASGPVVQWGGYRALADELDGRAVFAGGPAEEGWLAELAGPHPVLPSLSIGAFAAAAARVGAVVANDSGLAHLATAARRGAEADPACVLVIYGSTIPERTGPPGSTAVLGPRVACAPCYAKSCPTQIECLELGVDVVLAALLDRLREA